MSVTNQGRFTVPDKGNSFTLEGVLLVVLSLDGGVVEIYTAPKLRVTCCSVTV